MSAQMLVLSLSGVLMITLVNRFGVDTAAAFGAALQIWNYIQMPAFAVGHGHVGDDGAERGRRHSGTGSRASPGWCALQRTADRLDRAC